MKKLVFTLLLATTVTVCRSESTTEWTYSPFIYLPKSARYAVSSVANSVQQTASSMSEYVLGSADKKETESCLDHRCLGPGLIIPRSGAEGRGTDSELTNVLDSPPQTWDVVSSLQDTVTAAWDSVQYTVYKKAEELTDSLYNTTAEFAENVRYIFREEFSNFLAYFLWESSAVTDPASDSLYQRLQKAVVHRILVVGLIIICLVIGYIFWHLYLGIFFILAFNCSALLIYKVLGPEQVYWLLWKCIEYIWYCLSFIWTHPYISSVVILLVFIGSIVWTLSSWRSKVEREERMEAVIVSMSTRLQEIEKQQEEMLKLLRELQSANSSQ